MTDPQHQQQQSEEAMRQAFEQFMITGTTTTTTTNNNGNKDGSLSIPKKKNKKKKKGRGGGQPQQFMRSSEQPQQHDDDDDEKEDEENDQARRYLYLVHKHQKAWKAQEHKAWQIIHAFQGTLERHWLDVDDNLGNVMSSIANLRHRIYLESQFLFREGQTKKEKVAWWKQPIEEEEESYHQLNSQDVQLALDYDLSQHEKMMAGTRTLLASLSDTQDALGRRLEELLLLVQDMEEVYDEGGQNNEEEESNVRSSSSDGETRMMNIQTALQSMNDLFVMLAMELHRKQCLVQTVLDSFTDDAMVLGEEDDDDKHPEGDGNHTNATHEKDPSAKDPYPQQVANHANRDWSRRTSRKSAIDRVTLQTVLDLGKKAS